MIVLSLSVKLFGENRLVKSAKLLPLSIKSINPIQNHITESYACILKILVVIVEPSMNLLISFGMCSTPKLSK